MTHGQIWVGLSFSLLVFVLVGLEAVSIKCSCSILVGFICPKLQMVLQANNNDAVT